MIVSPRAIVFDVIGTPAPKGSWRVMRKGNFLPDNPRTKPWSDSVAWKAREVSQGRLLTGPLRVTIEFRLPRPKTVKRQHPSSKPDVDKLTRALFDACNHVLWSDDALVVDVRATKVYADAPSVPGATITVEEL